MGCRSEAYWAARWVFAVCCHRRWSRCRQSTNRTAARIIQTPCWSPQPRCYKLRQTERTEATRRSTWCVPTVCVSPPRFVQRPVWRWWSCQLLCHLLVRLDMNHIFCAQQKYRHAVLLCISATYVWLAWQSCTLYGHHPPQHATQEWFRYNVHQSVKQITPPITAEPLIKPQQPTMTAYDSKTMQMEWSSFSCCVCFYPNVLPYSSCKNLDFYQNQHPNCAHS